MSSYKLRKSVGLSQTRQAPAVTDIMARHPSQKAMKHILEQSEKIARLFKSVVDVPGARYFTFDGSYDMSKLMVVEDADGNQSLMIPFAK